MTEMKTITCDHCKKQLLVESSYPAVYSIEIKCINTRIPHSGGTFAVAVHPPFKGTLHFCNLKCLDGWRTKND